MSGYIEQEQSCGVVPSRLVESLKDLAFMIVRVIRLLRFMSQTTFWDR